MQFWECEQCSFKNLKGCETCLRCSTVSTNTCYAFCIASRLISTICTIPLHEIVALLGGNGAGKSTTLKAISTMLASERGKVTNGSINYDGHQVRNQNPTDMVRLGMVQVLEGRRCFGHLTVEENIIAGAYSRRLSKKEIQAELEKIYNYFQRLRDRRKSQAGFTSGGEQQMLAIARGLMGLPKLLMVDEPFLGLSPCLLYTSPSPRDQRGSGVPGCG